LRPGAQKPMKYIKYDTNTNGNNGNNGNRNSYNNRNNRNNNTNGSMQTQKDEETADETDDPSVWWKFQTQNTKLKFLNALMAEKVFKKYSDSKVSCPTCANKGMIGTTLPGGNQAGQRCPTCRGSGVLYKIIYR